MLQKTLLFSILAMKMKIEMGIVKEPDGIDFLVKSKPPTKQELELMSAHIAAYKKKLLGTEKPFVKQAATKDQVGKSQLSSKGENCSED